MIGEPELELQRYQVLAVRAEQEERERRSLGDDPRPSVDGIPKGFYFAFEDLPMSTADWQATRRTETWARTTATSTTSSSTSPASSCAGGVALQHGPSGRCAVGRTDCEAEEVWLLPARGAAKAELATTSTTTATGRSTTVRVCCADGRVRAGAALRRVLTTVSSCARMVS